MNKLLLLSLLFTGLNNLVAMDDAWRQDNNVQDDRYGHYDWHDGVWGQYDDDLHEGQ